MSTTVVLADVCAALAAAVVVTSCLGVLVMADALDKLHFVTPIGVVAPVLVALSVTFREGWSTQAATTWVTAALLVGVSPVLGHATARAIQVRRCGDWRPQGGQR